MEGYDYHGVQVSPADPEAVRKDREAAERYGFHDGPRRKTGPQPAPNPDGPYGGPYQG